MERRGKQAGKRVLRFAVSSSLLVPAVGCGGQEQEPTVNEPPEEPVETTVSGTSGTEGTLIEEEEDLNVNEPSEDPTAPPRAERPVYVNQIAEPPPLPEINTNERREPPPVNMRQVRPTRPVDPVPRPVYSNERAPQVPQEVNNQGAVPSPIHSNPGQGTIEDE